MWEDGREDVLGGSASGWKDGRMRGRAFNSDAAEASHAFSPSKSPLRVESSRGAVEVGEAYPLLPVSSGSASIASP